MTSPTQATRPVSVAPSDFERLATIRLPLILLVVLFHNELGGRFIDQLNDAPLFAGVIDWVANGLGGIRVPAFYLIAGYIFFRNSRPSVDWFRSKFNARGRSVLLPLILWTTFWLLVFAFVQPLPFISSFFSGSNVWSRPLLSMRAMDVVLAFFGPPNDMFIYPLWFLRDLFILVLITPAIYWLITLSRGWVTVLLFANWCAGFQNHVVTPDALFFFVAGSHLAIRGKSIFITDRAGWIGVLGWVVLQSVDITEFGLAGVKVKALAGIIGILYLSGVISRIPSASKFLNDAAHYSFFIFVAHEPLFTFTRKIYFRVVQPSASIGLLTAYFAIVVITVAILIVAFKLSLRLAPRALELMTGGRT